MSGNINRLPSPDYSMNLLYHHGMPASMVMNSTIRADRTLSDPEFLPAYEWVEDRLGFFPLFTAVGALDEIAWMTGYPDNWRVWTGGECVEGKYRKIYRRKGEFPNLALLSFDTLEGVFMDYDYWHIAINACMNGSTVIKKEETWIFKPSWTKSRWLRSVLAGTHRVQLVTPDLPLGTAGKVRVRNRATRRLLEARGFKDVEISRMRVNP
jgi:hypothetical protein